MELVGNAIEEEFGNQVQYLFEGTVSTRIDRIETGSITGTVVLILGAGLAVYEFISKYRDFYDSLVLLKRQLRSFINQALQRAFRNSMRINTNVVLTRVPIHIETPQAQATDRDPPALYLKTFFWYLIIMNILLMIIIALLVYPAIQMVYLSSLK